MKNFPFDHNGQEFWYSRSCTSVAFVFARSKETGEWHVLANKRGKNAPSCKGMWNVPCGYLDFGERIREAAAREAYEETGIKVPVSCLRFFHMNDKPVGQKQNIAFLHFGILNDYIEDLPCNLDHMEPGEVEEAKWIPIFQLKNYKWAYQHYTKIMVVYDTFVNIPWYKKLWLNFVWKITDHYNNIYTD